MFFFVSNYENGCEKRETKSGETEYVLYMYTHGECRENFVHSVVCLQKKIIFWAFLDNVYHSFCCL